MKKVLILILAVVMLLSLMACGSSDKNKLIGTWELLDSHYLKIGSSSVLVNATYTYSFSKDDTFTYEYDSEAFSTPTVKSGRYTIKDGIITLTFESGKVETIALYQFM